MPRLKQRTLITLVDENGKVIEKKTANISLLKAASVFELKSNLDKGDKIIVESEEL